MWITLILWHAKILASYFCSWSFSILSFYIWLLASKYCLILRRNDLFASLPYTWIHDPWFCCGTISESKLATFSELGLMQAMTLPKHDRLLVLLAWQATIYLIWTERNSRIHRQQHRSISSLAKQADLLIRNREKETHLSPQKCSSGGFKTEGIDFSRPSLHIFHYGFNCISLRASPLRVQWGSSHGFRKKKILK